VKATVMRRIEKRLQGIETQLECIAGLMEMKPHKCLKCNGTGVETYRDIGGPHERYCSACGGAGKIWRKPETDEGGGE